MAYIPQHKRQSKDNDNSPPIPTPFFLLPQFKRKLNLGSSSTGPKSRMKNDTARRGGKIIYAKDSISKWFIECGSATSDGDEPPAKSFRMEPFRLLKSLEWKRSGEPFNIRSELLSSFRNFREEMESGEVGVVLKPTFVVRIGKILFHGKQFSGGVTSRADAEMAFGRVGRSFL
ncbi:hypothetical protein MKW98_004925 [Papaver atlanticum]|uniref:DUF7903 domain-containing protein n=1 Tax=Papaver atlanticum TaxID=357466 RepID=A0AAD4XF54_9MAGN|nr:hypothetical protein MKW98_004925 [Papaver atlanticum]